MKSIRPLVTITLLTVAGVFLYFKINETQPQLPPEAVDWNLPAQVGFQDLAAVDESTLVGIQEFPVKTEQNSVPVPSVSEKLSPEITGKVPSWNDATAIVANPGPTPSEVISQAVPDMPPLPVIPNTPLSTEPQAATAPVAPHTTPTSKTQSTTSQAQAESLLPAMKASPQASLFGATRLAVQGALDRGELSQALLLLSDWYGDPSLAEEENEEVNRLLGQLAGSVIYSTEHRLEPSYQVQAGENLEEIAKKYSVPWQLLAKINGIQRPHQLQAGEKIKVLRGPFSAIIDLGDRQMTLMLARRYAGKFAIEFDPQVSVEEGHWSVDQKLVTPASLSMTTTLPPSLPKSQSEGGADEEPSLVLINAANAGNQIAILKGVGTTPSGVATEPMDRVIRLKTSDVQSVYEILSVGSKVIIRK